MNSRNPSRNHLRHAVALALATAALAPAYAMAQQSEGLEEVTVTATRRTDTNLQTTPVSVTAVTAGDIERSVAKDISQLASSVPGFSAARVTAFNAASFAMRGVGITDIIVYQDSPVSVQIDDFVMPSVQTQLLDTFDMASVEVLRGPQGTLFGKNSTGGTVNIKTKRPNMTEQQAAFRLGYGSFNEVNAIGSVDLPIINDVLSVRVAGSYVKSDGYYRLGASYGPISNFGFTIPGFTGTSGQGSGERAGGQDVKNARVKVQWQPTDNLTALFQYEVMRDRSDAVPAFNDTPVGSSYLWNLLGFTRPTGDPLKNMGSSQRNDQLLGMGNGQVLDVDGAYLNLDWQLNDNYTLYSVTGYRHQEEHLPNTYTGAAPVNTITGEVLSLFDASRDTSRDTFQQEVRIASKLDGPFNYVAGGFYQRNDATFCVIQVLGFVDLITNWQGLGLPQTFFNNTPQVLCNNQKSTSVAGYVDGTWDVTDKFQLGAGVRYTRDEKEWDGRTQVQYGALDPSNPGLTAADVGSVLGASDFSKYPGGEIRNSSSPGFGNLKTSWKKPTWRLTGSYKITDNLFSYATISRGYKAGGYNDQTGTNGVLVPELTRPVNPEYATNYEVGFKFQSEDNRFRFNPTFFYTKYSDVQRAVNIPVISATGNSFQETVFYNAAKVTSKGAELEFQALVTDNFRIKAAASWLEAKYDEFVINQPALSSTSGAQILEFNGEFSGLPVPRSPKTSLSVSGTYTWDLAAAGRFELTGEGYHEAKNLYYISAAGRQYDAYLNAKLLWNAGLTYTTEDDKYFVRVYGKNLSDQRYKIASQSVATLWTHTQYGAPRNFGITFGVNFGN